jgi:hypothetical protein
MGIASDERIRVFGYACELSTKLAHDVQAGDVMLGFGHCAGETMQVRVSSVTQGARPLFDITVEGGRRVRVDEHCALYDLYSGWTAPNDLTVGESLVGVLGMSYEEEANDNYDDDHNMDDYGEWYGDMLFLRVASVDVSEAAAPVVTLRTRGPCGLFVGDDRFYVRCTILSTSHEEAVEEDCPRQGEP